MSSTIPRPPFDPELEAVLALLADQIPPTLTPELIPVMRAGMVTPSVDELIGDRPVSYRVEQIPGHRGDPIEVTVFQRTGHSQPGPAIYHTHGGGMILGDRYAGIEPLLNWVEKYDAVAVTVEYRLAPEFPDPFPVEDCYAGLVWTAENAARLGIDAERLLIYGASAGGGLAAGVSLLSRDRKGPALIGQGLIYPMLDDRDLTISTQQIDGVGVWDRGSNITGWNGLLGERRGGDDVSIYAAPSRATDLSGLPPAFITCGSAEVFRDEDVAYASAIWAAGGQAELHVWPGGFHGSDMLAPHVRISQLANEATENWIARLLGA